MTSEISDLVDEPELLDAADDISIDRWTEYGHDRLYINGGRVEPYIDLEDGSLGDKGMVPVNAEFDGDTVTVEIGDEDGHSRHDVIVISLSGDVDDNGEEGEDGAGGDGEEGDDGTDGDEEGVEDSDDEFSRIETTDEKPGFDASTIREGDVLELVSGQPGNEGARFRVKDRTVVFGDVVDLEVEQVGGPRTSRRKIVNNGTGPMFKPVKEAEL